MCYKRNGNRRNSCATTDQPCNQFSKAFVNSSKTNFLYQLPMKVNGPGFLKVGKFNHEMLDVKFAVVALRRLLSTQEAG